MSDKIIKSWNDVDNTADAIAYARHHGANVVVEGEKLRRIETGKGAVHLHENCRTLGKCEREQIKCWYWQLGLPVLAFLLLFFIGWLLYAGVA